MQTLKTKNFRNIQTGNVAELVIDNGICVYYKEACTWGIVAAGINEDGCYWASWASWESTHPYGISDAASLDDALIGLESLLEETAESNYWHHAITGY
jgi:predicted RNase H-like HicB family nuclease